MLVLSRKTRQQIQIGDNVVVTILLVKGNTVRVGIEAPRNVRVVRSELPLHEQSETAPAKLQLSIQGEESSVAETAEPQVSKKANSKLKSMLSSIERADRAERTGPVLAALRRRSGLNAMPMKPTASDASDLTPIFDHH
jgi:carbon storage regulator CsrA